MTSTFFGEPIPTHIIPSITFYFVDGNYFNIPRDDNEPPWRYYLRVAYSLNGDTSKNSVEQRVANSRVHLNRVLHMTSYDSKTEERYIAASNQ